MNNGIFKRQEQMSSLSLIFNVFLKMNSSLSDYSIQFSSLFPSTHNLELSYHSVLVQLPVQ